MFEIKVETNDVVLEYVSISSSQLVIKVQVEADSQEVILRL